MIYVAGCDVSGGGSDEFAWAVAHREGEHVIVDLVRARGRPLLGKFSPEQAVAACASDLRAYKISSVVGDHYAAQWPVEAFRRHSISYVPSARTKSELYLELLPLVTAGRVELPPDPETVRQLKLLIRRTGTQGKDNIDHPQGARDDRINSVALAVSQLEATVELRPDHFQFFGERATSPAKIFLTTPDSPATEVPRYNTSDRPWDPGVLDDPFNS